MSTLPSTVVCRVARAIARVRLADMFASIRKVFPAEEAEAECERELDRAWLNYLDEANAAVAEVAAISAGRPSAPSPQAP